MMPLRYQTTLFPHAANVNPRRAAEIMYTGFRRMWRDATREFIAAVVLHTKVDTTMTRASLIPLAVEVRFKTAITPFIAQGQKRRQNKGLTLIGGEYIANAFRSKYEGIKLGERAYKISLGSVTEPIFMMEFQIAVFQHLFWEPDQRSIEKGRKAFLDFVANHWKDYFSPKDLAYYLLTGDVLRTLREN